MGVVKHDLVDKEQLTAILNGGVASEVFRATDEVQGLQQQIDSVRAIALSPPNLTNGTGEVPAENIKMPNGQKLSEWYYTINLGQGGTGPGAPQITTDPTISDTTPAVDQQLTFTAGTKSGPTSTNAFRVNLDGVPGVYSAEQSGATLLFTVPASFFGLTFTITHRAIDALTGLFYERTSNVTSAVSGTAPTNSVLPSISPSGSQVSGTEITVSVGTWANASTYGIQLLDNGVPFGSRSATTTYTLPDSQAGHVITANVIATSSLGIPSANSVTTSNSVTVTGAATVTNTVLPALSANVYLGQANVGTAGTWTGAAINSTRNYNFGYIRGGVETLFRTGNTIPTITPTTAAGVVVDDVIFMDEIVTITSTGLTDKARSLTKVVQQAPAALALTLTNEGSAGYTWVEDQAISAATPFTISGTGGPYVVSIPGLPSGLSLTNGNSLPIIGTPANTSGSTAYTATVTGPGESQNITFNAQVNAAGVVALLTMPYPAGGNFQPAGGGGDYNGTSTVSSAGKTFLQPIIDPNGSGRSVYLNRIYRVDSNNGSTSVRAEVLWNKGGIHKLVPNTNYWFAGAFNLKSDEWTSNTGLGGDEGLFWQSHADVPGDTQPPIKLEFLRANGTMRYRASYQTVNQGSNYTTESNVTPSGGSVNIPTPGTWYRWIVYLRPGWTTAHAPRYQVWESRAGGAWTQLFNHTGFNDYNSPNGSYMRTGWYKYTAWHSGNATLAMYRTTTYFGIGANLFAEAQASLSGLA